MSITANAQITITNVNDGAKGDKGDNARTYVTLNTGDDLNTKLTKDYVYVTSSTAVCASLLNTPSGFISGECRMEIEQLGSNAYLIQRLFCKAGTACKSFTRTYSSGTFGSWVELGVQGERGLQGLQGPQGTQGIPGTNGTNGTNGLNSYFHIKYSANANGNPMSETPNTYIGTYVDNTAADSNDYTVYTWAQFRGSQGPQGNQGIPGANGTNGKTSYLHIAYATAADGSTGFSVSDSVNKTYIGQCTDFTLADPTTASSYSWTKIKGETGATGATGAQGAAGKDYWVSKSWVDLSASTYDRAKWYPVIGTVLANNGFCGINVSVQLNSGVAPSWSTHSAGFSVDFNIETQRSGWGCTDAETIIYTDNFKFCSVSPVSYTQLTYGSIPVLYMRGGGKYYVQTTYSCTWTVHSTTYTWTSGSYSQSAEVKTSRPTPMGHTLKGEKGNTGDAAKLFILKASPETYVISRRDTSNRTITIVPQVSGYSSVSIVYGTPSAGSISGNTWTIPASAISSSISVTATLNGSVTYTLTVNGVESSDNKPMYWGKGLPTIPAGQQALAGDYYLDGFIPRRCPSDGTAPSATNWPAVNLNDPNYSEIMANIQADVFNSISPDSVLGAQFGYIVNLVAKYVTADIIASFEYIVKNGGLIKSENFANGSDGYPDSGFLLDSSDGIGRMFGVKIKGLDAISATIRGNIIHDYFKTVDPTSPGSTVTFLNKTHWKTEDIVTQLNGVSGVSANRVVPMGGSFNSKAIAGIILNNTGSNANSIACSSGVIEGTTGTVTKTYTCLHGGSHTIAVSPMRYSRTITGMLITGYGSYSIKVNSTVVKSVSATGGYNDNNNSSSWTGTVNKGDVVTITATGLYYSELGVTASSDIPGSWSIVLNKFIVARTLNLLLSDNTMTTLEISKYNLPVLSFTSGPNGAVSISSSSYIKYALPITFIFGVSSLPDGSLAPASGSMIITTGGSAKAVEYVKKISSTSMAVFFSDKSSISFSAGSQDTNESNAYPVSGSFTLLGDSGGIKVGDTLPLVTDIYKLGSLAKRFKDLYCKNGVMDSLSANGATITSISGNLTGNVNASGTSYKVYGAVAN